METSTVETTSLADLRSHLLFALDEEKKANKFRLEIEKQIANHPDVLAFVKEEGTTTIPGLFKVTTGFTRKWDQDILLNLAIKVDPKYFPFKIKYDEKRAESKMIEEKFPDLWQILQQALTLTPSKATIKPIVDKE